MGPPLVGVMPNAVTLALFLAIVIASVIRGQLQEASQARSSARGSPIQWKRGQRGTSLDRWYCSRSRPRIRLRWDSARI